MNGTAFGPDLSLTPDQEGFLRTALSSNKPNSSSRIPTGPRSNSDPNYKDNSAMANGTNLYTPPIQQAPGSGQLNGYDDSPFLDYNLDDGDFDWDNNSGDQLFGDLPGEEYHEEGEHHDKRKASSEEEEGEEGSSKRREGVDKGAKKPGRKPLTGEPTTVGSGGLLLRPFLNDTLVIRNARHRIELLREPSVSAKNVILRISKPKSRTSKRPPKRLTTKMGSYVHKSKSSTRS